MLSLLLALALLAPAARAGSGEDSAPAARRAQSEYLRGTLLEKQGAFAEALAAFEKALELDPSSAFVAGEAAELALELQDNERAERWARRRLELAPNDAKSRVLLGRVLWARGDASAAEGEFEKARELDPSNPDTLFALSGLVAGRDPKKARQLLDKFLKENPQHAARALLELGRLDAQEARYADAIEKLKRSIALDESESDPARLTLAQVYEVTRDTRAAIVEYRRLLAEDPDDAELWAHVGELEAASGELEQARDTFRRLKEKRPDDPAACAWLAGDAERAGDFKAAAGYLKDSAALENDPTLHLRLGYYQLQGGSMKEAMETLGRARKRWPKDDRVAYYLALGHDDMGRREEAVELLREVLSVKPDDRDARWQLAATFEKLDRMDESEAEFRKLLAEKPEDAPALNYLGYSLADRGRKLEEAEALIRRALALEPANPAYRDSLGWALFKLGRSTEAARELAASARAFPDDDTVWDHLGEARKAMGREEAAWRAWRVAQALGSKTAGAKADALQRPLPRESIGELWRAHLEGVHGGLRRLSGVCEIKGRVREQQLERRALLSFRAPKELTLELMGPFFAPVARARVDHAGFMMDRLPVDGIPEEQLRAAAELMLSAVAGIWAGEPFAPGPAKYESGWGRRELARPAWRIELGDDALGRSAVFAKTEPLSFAELHRDGLRRLPKSFEAKGRGWSFSLSCPEPKVELEPLDLLPESTP